eukprot:6185244-Pleurochrysis_carterae.AAC.5
MVPPAQISAVSSILMITASGPSLGCGARERPARWASLSRSCPRTAAPRWRTQPYTAPHRVGPPHRIGRQTSSLLVDADQPRSQTKLRSWRQSPFI